MDQGRVGEAEEHERHRGLARTLVKVLYFAAARDIARTRDEGVSLRDGATLEDLASEVVRLHPQLSSMKRSVRFSVNLEVANPSAKLSEGDEVGVLPPVAGG
jgi:molybdopterin converting factor subunit 1